MKSPNIAQNATYFTLALATQKILSFVYFIFVARAMGVENTGRYAFALSFCTLFAILLDFGLGQVLIRESARNRDNAAKYLANILGIKAVGAFLVYGLVVLAVNLMHYPELTKNLVYIAGLVMIADSFSNSFFAVLRGLQNLRFESIGVVGNQLIVLLLGLVVIKFNLGLVALMSVYFFGSAFNLILSASIVRQKLAQGLSFAWDRTIIRNIAIIAMPFGVAGLFSRIYSSIDMVFLSKLTDDYAVGIYSVAYKIAFALQFVGVAFSASLYPAFCRYFVASREQLARTFTKALYYLLIISLPVATGVILLADKVIGPVFGERYAPAAIPLSIFMMALVFIFLCFPTGALLNAANRQTRNTVHLGIIALVNVVLNLILIPLYSFNGAALATLASYVLLFVMGLFVCDQIVDYDRRRLFWSFVKVTISCALMTAVVLPLKNQVHFALLAPAGALIYVVALLALRGLTREDFNQLKSLVSKS